MDQQSVFEQRHLSGASRDSSPLQPRPYHDRVFRLADLKHIIAEHGLPVGAAEDDYQGYAYRPFEKYIEVQL